MLTSVIISLISVIAFAIFEYTHNKATYSLKTAWYKYAVAFILSTFGFSYLTQWKYFQWLEQGAFVIAFLFFFWVIVQKLNIKGLPGQSAAKVIIAVVSIGLLTSCSQNYHNKVENTLQSSVYRQGFMFSAAVVAKGDTSIDRDYPTEDSIKKGYVDTIRIGTQYFGSYNIGSYNFTHKMFLIKKTSYQNWTEFWHTGWRITVAFIGLIVVIWSLWTFIAKTSTAGGLSNMARIVPLFIGLAMLGCSIYPWSDEGYISAAQYDANQAKDGDQRAYDWNNIQGL